MSSSITINKQKPNHFITTADYTSDQLLDLVFQAIQFKVESKYNYPKPRTELPLAGKTMALMFSKRSTRTRVATETAVGYLGNALLDMSIAVN